MAGAAVKSSQAKSKANIREKIANERQSITPARRFRAVSKTLVKHGILHILKDRSRDEESRYRLLGQRLRLAFQELGPTYIKLGQVMLTRQELLPDALTRELEPLLAEVPPIDFAYMEVVLDESMPNWRDEFDFIHPVPIGSASLAQVYQAYLQDGRRAAVKIVRPLARKLFSADIAAIRKLVGRLQRFFPVELRETLDVKGLLQDYYSSSMNELDMRLEAEAMNQQRQYCDEFATLHIPQVYCVKPQVLVMEYIDGWNLKDFPVDFLTFEERLERMADLAHYYVKMFLKGFYHADPHGSNIMIERTTKRAVILDWGMTGRMDTLHTEAIFRMLLHIRVNQAEDAAESALDIYEPTIYTHPVQLKDQLRSLFIHYTDSHQGSHYNWGNLLFRTIMIALKNHCRIPTGLALWAKGFSAAEGNARWLCPEISFHDLVETADVQIVRDWMSRRLNYHTNAALLTETAKLATTFPRRLNKILEHLEWNKLQFTIDAQLSQVAQRNLSRLTNRVAFAFLAGILFLGGAILITSRGGNFEFSLMAHRIGMIALSASALFILGVIWNALRARL
ncbi:ABC1 kinase family protein [Alicyclobacillus tolerans]|uniref:ABC1 kinase family protein n=1 Tax=Alicyclobacillus tolerans TaxID=90970 RepID=UPI003B7E9B26